MKRVVSKHYRDGARGQPCRLRIPGVCTGGGDDTVFAHIRDLHSGRSIKASDISGCDADAACHRVFDRQAKMPDGSLLSEQDWLFYALRGLQETIENRIERGIISIKLDAPSTKTAKPRKPKEQRAKISPGRPLQSNSNFPPGRKLQSRKLP